MLRRWQVGWLVLLGSLLWGTGLIWAQGLAATSETPVKWWLATSLGAGAISPDQDLANYRWDTAPTAQYALQAMAGQGSWAAGMRFSRWATTQGTGLAAGGPEPEVRLNNFDLVAQVRLVQWAGFEMWGTGLAGLVNLTYTPDHLVIGGAGAGDDVTVNYAPITETNLGLGVEIRRAFGRRLNASIAAERAGFKLDTSHRRGNEIVNDRVSFQNWSLRLQVAWVLDLG